MVTLQDPPENLRPGLSATAKITTATRDSACPFPIQALTIRSRGDLKTSGEKEQRSGRCALQRASNTTGADKEEVQGVFVFRDRNKVEFVPVQTGITGTTDIEVLNGLKEGDEIVTGSYKVLRTLRQRALASR